MAGPYSFTWGKEGEIEVVTQIKHPCGEKVDGAWGRLDTVFFLLQSHFAMVSEF